jgi:uncharacterized protein YndB with AHSA1/START domain
MNTMVESTFTIDELNRQVIQSRVFDAPQSLLFDVFTKAEHIPHWWTNTTVDKLDVRPGGEWRFVSQGKGGEFVCGGVFQEVSPPDRIVQTFGIEANPGHEFIQTITFTPQGDKTLVTTETQFKSAADLNQTVNYGMKNGADYGYARIDAYLASLTARS